MAPSRTPRRAKPNEHWENIGVRGRKTGVMLKASVRDEHGLESIEGIFSSPEKSPVKQNGLNQISNISEGESMDIGHSTIPDPTEVISRARNGKNLLPPRSRSPIKTNIGSSPRRSLGPVSSPSRVQNGVTPTRSMSHPPDNSTFEDTAADPEVTPETPPVTKKRGRPKTAPPSTFEDTAADSEVMPEIAPVTKKRGRPKTVPPEATSMEHDSPQISPASERVADAKMKPPPRPNAKSLAPKPKPTQPENGRSMSRSVLTARSQTPADDIGAVRMKTGRTSIRPVAFWRNERIVYGDGNLEGKVLTLPGIKEVIRTEEIEGPPRPKATYRRPKPKREQEDTEREPWETETGIVRAHVMQWDPVIGRYDEENTEETEVAYAAEAIEMRDISGAEFRFAKTLTLPFFGSGMVDLPPRGAKRVKNSRKMQMVFFVFYGRVTVDVGTPSSSFSIGKGGVWQVPRGNFYSITNHSEKNAARIFFAQGCEVNPETTFDESAGA